MGTLGTGGQAGSEGTCEGARPLQAGKYAGADSQTRNSDSEHLRDSYIGVPLSILKGPLVDVQVAQ